MTEEGLSENAAPYERLIQTESKKIVYNFCTLCSLLENKKLSLGNIFTILTEQECYQNLLMQMLSEDDLIESLKIYLVTFPDILSNKSVKLVLQTWR